MSRCHRGPKVVLECLKSELESRLREGRTPDSLSISCNTDYLAQSRRAISNFTTPENIPTAEQYSNQSTVTPRDSLEIRPQYPSDTVLNHLSLDKTNRDTPGMGLTSHIRPSTRHDESNEASSRLSITNPTNPPIEHLVGDIVRFLSSTYPLSPVDSLHTAARKFLTSTEFERHTLSTSKVDTCPSKDVLDLKDVKSEFTLRTPFAWNEGLGRLLYDLPDPFYSTLEGLGDVTLALGLDIFPRDLPIENIDLKYFTGIPPLLFRV